MEGTALHLPYLPSLHTKRYIRVYLRAQHVTLTDVFLVTLYASAHGTPNAVHIRRFGQV